MLDALLDRFRRGDRQALARLISLAARGEHGAALDTLPAPSQPSMVIALTGSPGAGKSTLVGRLIDGLRAKDLGAKGRRVAVLACDPQSPRTGGALLGDRCRMPGQPDDGLFIRSLATPGGQGAIAPHLDVIVRLLETFGFDTILIETVGAGQGDTAVVDIADAVVLLVQPESGDELQWEKAGVLEIADVIVVHKADLPGAEQTAAHARAELDLVKPSNVPVISVSSKTGSGINDLIATLSTLPRQENRSRKHENTKEMRGRSTPC